MSSIPAPPVRQATTVRAGAEQTFSTFVRRIGDWWPVDVVSVGRERVRDVRVEPRLGGRFVEVWDDGTTVDWAEITTWEPSDGFVLAWDCTPARTEVELRFRALGPGLTRVELEHRGWEALTEAQQGEDCAAPGGYLGGAYAEGWLLILSRLAAAAEGADEA
jgi:hypothetical protein